MVRRWERPATGRMPGEAAAASPWHRRPARLPPHRATPTGTPLLGARRGSDDRRDPRPARCRRRPARPSIHPVLRRMLRAEHAAPREAGPPPAPRPAAGARTSTSRMRPRGARHHRPLLAARAPRRRSPRSAPPTCRAGPTAGADRQRQSAGSAPGPVTTDCATHASPHHQARSAGRPAMTSRRVAGRGPAGSSNRRCRRFGRTPGRRATRAVDHQAAQPAARRSPRGPAGPGAARRPQEVAARRPATGAVGDSPSPRRTGSSPAQPDDDRPARPARTSARPACSDPPSASRPRPGPPAAAGRRRSANCRTQPVRRWTRSSRMAGAAEPAHRDRPPTAAAPSSAAGTARPTTSTAGRNPTERRPSTLPANMPRGPAPSSPRRPRPR